MRIFQSNFETIVFTKKGNTYILGSVDFPPGKEYEKTNLKVEEIIKDKRYEELDWDKLNIGTPEEVKEDPSWWFDYVMPKFILEEE